MESETHFLAESTAQVVRVNDRLQDQPSGRPALDLMRQLSDALNRGELEVHNLRVRSHVNEFRRLQDFIETVRHVVLRIIAAGGDPQWDQGPSDKLLDYLDLIDTVVQVKSHVDAMHQVQGSVSADIDWLRRTIPEVRSKFATCRESCDALFQKYGLPRS
jgi:hypothetical protein